jgi:TonB-linked SusC/RagA family outer membrane protein
LGGTANIHDIQLALSGGNQNTSFRLGGGVHNEGVIYDGDFGFRRMSGNLSINHISPNERLHVSINLNYGANRNKLLNDADFVRFALTLPPNAPKLYDESGDLNWAIVSEFGMPANSWSNPLSNLRKRHEIKGTNLIANAILSYNIADGFTVKSNLGYTKLDGTETVKAPIAAFSPTQGGLTGSSTFGSNQRSTWLAEPQATYIKTWGRHSINSVVGATWQENYYLYQSIMGTGYTSDVLLSSIRAAATKNFLADDEVQYRYQAFFGRMGYSFAGRYFLDLTGRRDGSSRFGPGRQYGNFGAAGAGWIFTEEEIMQGIKKVMDFGKIRASYGVTGNDQIGDYQFYDTYSIASDLFQGSVNLYPTALFNPEYRWEATRKIEAALELVFFESRISIQAAWYRNRSSNQLVNYQLPATTGFSSVNSNFDAVIENSGWEVNFNTRNIVTEKMQWTTAFNISIPRNKLIEFEGIEESPYANTFKVGQSLSVRRLYEWIGVDQTTGAHKFRDRNDDGRIISDDDMIFTSSLDRRYFGGISNSVRYGPIEVSFLVQFSNQKANKYLAALPGRMGNQPIEVLERWRQEGDIVDIQRVSTNTRSIYGRAYNTLFNSSYNIQSGSFARLKTLSISYQLPAKILKSVFVADASIYVQAQNLFTVTNFRGLDPETGSLSLPPLRMITTGILLKF